MSSISISEGSLLWEPSEELKATSIMRRYMDWLRETRGVTVDDYQTLWQWSTDHIEDFWASLVDFYGVQFTKPYTKVLASHDMPGAQWFVDGELSYAQHMFRHATSARPAILFQSETQPLTEISWATLAQQVASVAQALRRLGVQRGDRVVAYMPNIPQTLVAFLACASLGATWSSCSPDFGSPSVIDRFKQIEPTVLFAIDGYQYGGKPFDRREAVREIVAALPTLTHVVEIPYLARTMDDRRQTIDDRRQTADGRQQTADDGPSSILVGQRSAVDGRPSTVAWDTLLTEEAELRFEPLPFAHPLYVLYSSGTTGLPKPIVHGQGGVLLEHLKAISLHTNLGPGDRFFWFTSTGWMMWNYLISGLLVGATIILYDGSPGYPDMNVLWKLAEQTRMTKFGTSAPYITACMKAGITPGATFDLSRLKAIGSTGAPLPPEGFAWVYQHIKPDLWLASMSGGTDVCTAFVMGCPLLPVRAGELQCLGLGCKIQAFDEEGAPLINQVGELVITEPMPSMPVFFWNDPNHKRYRDSYFTMYPDVWRHGDWIKITPQGSAVIYGRSDSTLNRQGVRMGTSEFYSVVESLPDVLDSLVIDLEEIGREGYMPLFVVLRPGVELTDDLKRRIKARIREALSPRHVPDDVMAITEVPRTLNGKKMEVPIKKILLGMAADKAANPDSMSNPQALKPFVDLAGRLKIDDGR